MKTVFAIFAALFLPRDQMLMLCQLEAQENKTEKRIKQLEKELEALKNGNDSRRCVPTVPKSEL